MDTFRKIVSENSLINMYKIKNVDEELLLIDIATLVKINYQNNIFDNNIKELCKSLTDINFEYFDFEFFR